MSTDEPAWKAEAASAIADALKTAAYECKGDCGLSEDECWDRHSVNWFATTNGVTHVHGRTPAIAEVAMAALVPHFQAAEERGRREALRRAAEKIRRELPETVKERLGGGVFEIRTVPTARQAADLIDPDVP